MDCTGKAEHTLNRIHRGNKRRLLSVVHITLTAFSHAPSCAFLRASSHVTSHVAFKIPTLLVAIFVIASGIRTAPVSADDKLPRIVSINLCADQLVMSFADDEQILSLSNLSHDAAGSYHVDKALTFPINKGEVEEVLPLQPDLVIAGQFTSRYTLSLLQAVGLRVEQLPIANSMEELFRNFEKVAQWTGHPSRGQATIDQFKSRLAALSQPVEPRPRVAIYDPNGYTVGAASLRGEALKLAGWHNVATDLGIDAYGSMALETLISLDPDALVESPYSAETWSRAQAQNAHPAIKQRGLKARVISIPSAQTICGGPWTIDVIERLEQERVASN